MPDLSCCVESDRYLAWKGAVGSGSSFCSVSHEKYTCPGWSLPATQTALQQTHKWPAYRCCISLPCSCSSPAPLEPMVNVPLAHTFLGFHEQKESEWSICKMYISYLGVWNIYTAASGCECSPSYKENKFDLSGWLGGTQKVLGTMGWSLAWQESD